jgi:hypothetical protein
MIKMLIVLIFIIIVILFYKTFSIKESFSDSVSASNIFSSSNICDKNIIIPECNICSTYTTIYSNKYIFRKINSLYFDLIQNSNYKGNDFELSNEIFNNNLQELIDINNLNYTYDFIDKKNDLSDKLYKIYEKIELYLLNKINSLQNFIEKETKKFEIIQRYINYFLIDKDSNKNYNIDFDILLYRNFKNQGKHININIMYINDKIYILCINVKGIVNNSDFLLNLGDIGILENQNYNQFSVSDIYDSNIYSLQKMNNADIDKYIEKHNKEFYIFQSKSF